MYDHDLKVIFYCNIFSKNMLNLIICSTVLPFFAVFHRSVGCTEDNKDACSVAQIYATKWSNLQILDYFNVFWVLTSFIFNIPCKTSVYRPGCNINSSEQDGLLRSIIVKINCSGFKIYCLGISIHPTRHKCTKRYPFFINTIYSIFTLMFYPISMSYPCFPCSSYAPFLHRYAFRGNSSFFALHLTTQFSSSLDTLYACFTPLGIFNLGFSSMWECFVTTTTSI